MSETSLQTRQPGTLDIGHFIEMAIEKSVPVETMERLLAMRDKLRQEQAKQAYDEALAAFQGECPIIQKSTEVRNSQAKGGGLRYRYAPMDAIIAQVRAPLQKHGFSYSLDTIVHVDTTPAWVETICKATHKDGHSETRSFRVPIDKDAFMNEQQKVASARTYSARYCFLGIFGIMTGDDDDDSAHASPEVTDKVPPKAKDVTPPAPGKEQKPASKPKPGTKQGEFVITGFVSDLQANPTKRKDSFRYKIVLDGNEKTPYYSFDKKVCDWVKENAGKGPAIKIVFTTGKFGNDIVSIGHVGEPAMGECPPPVDEHPEIPI